MGQPIYNKWQSGAENGGKEYLASNQVIGSSNRSGRTIFFNGLTHFGKIESSHKNRQIKVVIGGWGVIAGSI